MSRVRKLTDIEIDEVSVVDRPANQHGLIAFSKSVYPGVGFDYEEGTMPPDADVYFDVDGDEVDTDLLEHGDVVYDANGTELVYLEEGAEEFEDEYVGKARIPASVLRRAKVGQAKFGAPPPRPGGSSGGLGSRGGYASSTGARSGYTPPPPPAPGQAPGTGLGAVGRRKKAEYVAAAQNAANRKKWLTYAGIGAGGAALGGGTAYALNKSAGDTVLEALSKAVTEDDRDEIIAKAMNEVEIYKAQTQEMAEALEYEQDLRITEEYISKAAEYNLPVSPAILGPILKSIAEVLSDEELDILDAIFEAIGDTLYDEVGYVGDTDNGSVVDMVDAYADELVGKSDLSHAEAAVAMYSAHPEAYEAYLAENGR